MGETTRQVPGAGSYAPGRAAWGAGAWISDDVLTGPDLPVTNAKLNQEFVTLKNTGTTSRDLTGWTVEDLAGHVYTFGHFTLKAGSKVVIHTGKGTNSSTDRYWGRGYYVWNNTGDKAKLHNAAGRFKDSCSWGNGPGSLYC